ncbi:MAG: sensor histidine kinase [Pseudomonadota bacterium]
MSSLQSTARRRWIFLLFLAALHLVFAVGPDNVVGRWLFISHIGLGLLWQPFVQPRRRLASGGLLVVLISTALLAYFLNWAILLLWTMLLAGVVGGKVFMFPDRWERVFHLAALGYLVMAVLMLILPAAVKSHALADPVLANLVLYLAPLVLISMAALPVKQGFVEERAEIVDFIYGMFVVLLLAVIVLGSLSVSLLFKSSYLESQLITLGIVAGVLLLLGFIWNPRAGFAGLGTAVAQHVMSLGLPVEEWLQSLAELGKHEEDPDRFIALACNELPQRLPGVKGGRWEAIGEQGVFGVQEGHRTGFAHGRLKLELVTRVEPSPALRWHYDLVVRLLSEFYLGKWRAQELKRLSYIQAIHETGARLTHDVKNLLQSLDTLCAAANEAGATSSPRFGELLRCQLPEVSARLRQTLDKLVEPGKKLPAEPLSAVEWLASLESRYADDDTTVVAEGDLSVCQLIDPVLFSSVAENLLQNIAAKRRRQSGLKATLRLACIHDDARLEISDDGSAIPLALAAKLLSERVVSEDGLGIGLYQCARQAEQSGYRFELARNVDGCVLFRLARAA